MNRSFVDLLFILLCGTIVLLSQSLQIGAVDAAPAKVGGGGISEVRADEVVLVVVGKDRITVRGPQGASIELADHEQLPGHVEPGRCVLLVPGDEQVSHHRVMQVWSVCRDAGMTVKLAAVAKRSNTGGRAE